LYILMFIFLDSRREDRLFWTERKARLVSGTKVKRFTLFRETSNLHLCLCVKKLHNEELRDLYFSPSIIRIIKSRRMRWAGHVARMGEKRNVYMLLVGKPKGKRPLGKPRRRWADNIKMNLGEIRWCGLDWSSSG
jgi:hypothetical protein